MLSAVGFNISAFVAALMGLSFFSSGLDYLQLTIFLPVLSVVFLLVVPSYNWKLVRQLSLFFSLIVWVFSLKLFTNFDPSFPGFQYESTTPWLSYFGLSYHIGIDGISLFLILLTTLLIPLCILVSWSSVRYNSKEFFILLFVIEFFLLNVFSVLDLFFFYIFFEAVLIPMFFIIGVWGSRLRRIHAAYQFFLYTLVGSLLMLLAIIYIFVETGSVDYYELCRTEFNGDVQKILWICFFASLATKIPMVPVHIWLPEAHVEAPTAGSVLLAGILLKLGGYGFIRFVVPVFPLASSFFQPLVYTMSVVAVIYTSLTTLRQIDLKKIIAYSSVAHMGFVTLGVFSETVQGIEGAILLMLSHGIISSALFICVGLLYDRTGTRLLAYYGGVVHFMPIYSVILLTFTMANMGMPGTFGFVSELLVLLGLLDSNSFALVLASTGIVLGAAYSVWMYNRLCFGPVGLWAKGGGFADLNSREISLLSPLLFLTLALGIYPNILLDSIGPSVNYIITLA